MATTCIVCVEVVPGSKIIQCLFCNFECCQSCVGKFIDNSKTDEITCMSCSKVWPTMFLYGNLPCQMIYGRGAVRKHRERSLIEQEKARLPETQIVLAHLLELERRRKEIDETSARLRKLKLEHQALMYHGVNGQKNNVAVEKVVCKCPKDECRGFIMSSKHSCGLCNTIICKSCHVVTTGEGHECKESDKETIKALKKTAKPCPSCGTLSIKTEGCDQVWCMMCHKAWSWKHEQVETGYIHATDFYNHMRANGLPIPARAGARGGACGRNAYAFAGVYNEICALHRSNKLTGYDMDNVIFLYRLYNMGREFNLFQGEAVMITEDLRMDFLKNKIDEGRWKSTLLRRDKESVFKTECNAMKTTFHLTIEDYCTSFVHHYKAKNVTEANQVIEEAIKFHELIEKNYANHLALFKYNKASPFKV